jgi:ferric-dicitrate binding protein FerR (iron transport regulator)
MTQKIDNLLARYFGGNASCKDMHELELWIAQSNENQQYFDQLTHLYEQLGSFEVNIPQPNTEEARERFISYMRTNSESETSNVVILPRKPWYRLWAFQAACIVAVLMIAATFLFMRSSEKEIILATTSSTRTEMLPDGTEVKLSKNSRISYRSDFGKENRLLKLEGEASFKVGHRGKGGLQIWVDKIKIEDIGTAFIVSAYPNSHSIIVKVTEGLVRLSLEDSKKINLKANEICRYNRMTKSFNCYLASSSVSTIKPNVSPMPDKHLHFNAVPLQEVVKAINEEYQVSINLESPEIGRRVITVNFEDENLETMLQVIAETLNLKVKVGSNSYLIEK